MNASSTTGPLTALRQRLHANGYRPVPITAPNSAIPGHGKIPLMKDWRRVCEAAAPDDVAGWERNRPAETNTGLLTGSLVGVDIDVLSADLASRLDRLAEALLGPTPLSRIGRAPKLLRCYRIAAPQPKSETSELLMPDGTKAQVEILGSGQQFVAYGTHPETGQPYRWLDSGPDVVPLTALPETTADDLGGFLAAAEAMLRKAGGRKEKERPEREAGPAKPRGRAKADRADDFFSAINRHALANIEPWFRHLFPTAEHQPGTGAWRVSSAALGREFEEDISVHPQDGGCDFGTRESCSAIDLMMRWGGAATPRDAAMQLCDLLNLDPAELGWRGSRERTDQSGPATGSSAVEAIVDELNGRYMVVNEAGKAVIYEPGFDPVLRRRRFDRITFEDLNRLYLNRTIEVGVDEKGRPILWTVAKVWLRHERRRQFIGGICFDPARRRVAEGVLNLWEGFAVTPRPGGWSLMREHIRQVICDGDDERFDYLMGWMARMLQRPAEQGEVAVVMKGGEGTGKGTLAKALLKIAGHHGLAISNAKHLIGNFNAHLRDAIFLFADEAFFAGDKSHVGVLKSLITEPYLTVEAKFQNAIQSPNFLHVMMASNEEWVVPASQDARRFFVLEVSEDRKSDHHYFGAIAAQMAAGGYEAMLHDLLAHDLTTFNVRAVPVTEGLQRQRKLSLPTTEAWWQDCLERGYVFRSRLGLEAHFAEWMPEASTELLFASYTDFAERRRERHPLTRESLGRFLKRVGCTPKRLTHAVVGEHLTDERDAYGNSRRIAKVIEGDRPPGYSVGPLRLARSDFTEAVNVSVEWSSDDDDPSGFGQ